MRCPSCENDAVPKGARLCPQCNSPLPRPPVIDYGSYIAERTKDFTGREWAFRAIDDWLGDPGGARVFMLTGKPGCGKTDLLPHGRRPGTWNGGKRK